MGCCQVLRPPFLPAPTERRVVIRAVSVSVSTNCVMGNGTALMGLMNKTVVSSDCAACCLACSI